MAQSYPDIEATDLISESRAKILDRDDAIKTNFSGTVFPTSNISVGMSCYRTDLGKMYTLSSTGPDVWREVQLSHLLGTAAFATIGTSGDTVPKNNAANTFGALQTFSAGIALGGQSISGTAGALVADTDLRLNAASGKDINFLINGTSRMKIYTDGGVTVGAPTSNSMGAGTLNAQYLYLNGTLVGTAATKNTGTSGDTIPKNNTANVFSATQKITNATLASLLLETTGNAYRVENSNGTFQVGIDGGSSLMQIASDGGMIFGSATGASQGAGKINAKGYYVDGVAIGGGKYEMEIFTASGTWSKPSGFAGKIKVTVLGGGGGGGNAGGAGGTTSFGSHCSSSGGAGGAPAGSGMATEGGIGSGGDLNIRGQAGYSHNNYINQSSTLYHCFSKGADTPFGQGGIAYQFVQSGGGNWSGFNAAEGYGAGGSGFGSGTSAPVDSGGAAGGLCYKIIDASALGSSETVTIGAGGTAPNGYVGRPGLVIVEYVG